MADIKIFKTEEEALDYASNLKKYGSELVKIGTKYAFLTSTSLPIEERLRDPVEIAVSDFLKELGIIEEREIDDVSICIGAEICGEIEEMITKMTGIEILCRYDTF